MVGKDILFKRARLGAGTVLLIYMEPRTGRVARWYTKQYKVQQNIKKSRSSIMADRGLVLVLLVLALALIVLLVIEDIQR